MGTVQETGVVNTDLAASLERIVSKAKKVPDPTTICRCGSQWKNGREEPIGWVFISDAGRGMVRRCEQCNPLIAQGRPDHAEAGKRY